LAIVGVGEALGEDTPDVAAFPSPTSAPLARLAAAVAGVGLLGWGVTVWTRRRSRSAPGGERIEVVARRSLGPRHHVAIVDAGGRRLLVGFAGDHISTLSDLTETQIFEEELGKNLASDPPAAQETVGAIGRFEGLDA
jgi:flagellar biogenesis protein FliO